MPDLPKIYTSLLLCNEVLKEDNGVLSAIRIVDKFIVPKLPVTEPASKVLALIEFWVLVIFKSATPCEFTATLSGLSPEGKDRPLDPQHFPVRLNGGAAGHQLMIRIGLVNPPEGDYWFNVAINGEIIQQTPARVTYLQQTPVPSKPSQTEASSE